MAESMTRRSALVSLSCLSVTGVAVGSIAMGPPANPLEKGPPLEPSWVKSFVGAGHGDLDEVKSMLADCPGLVNATWDWGGGDYETALGGASHMGRTDIAEYLLEQGARIDLFAAAMLGRLEIIKAAFAVYPSIWKVQGPHGIPLIVHAEKGGDQALEVLKFLREAAPGC